MAQNLSVNSVFNTLYKTLPLFFRIFKAVCCLHMLEIIFMFTGLEKCCKHFKTKYLEICFETHQFSLLHINRLMKDNSEKFKMDTF